MSLELVTQKNNRQAFGLFALGIHSSFTKYCEECHLKPHIFSPFSVLKSLKLLSYLPISFSPVRNLENWEKNVHSCLGLQDFKSCESLHHQNNVPETCETRNYVRLEQNNHSCFCSMCLTCMACIQQGIFSYFVQQKFKEGPSEVVKLSLGLLRTVAPYCIPFAAIPNKSKCFFSCGVRNKEGRLHCVCTVLERIPQHNATEH